MSRTNSWPFSMPALVGGAAFLAVIGALATQMKPAGTGERPANYPAKAPDTSSPDAIQDYGDNPLKPVYRCLGVPLPTDKPAPAADASLRFGLLAWRSTLTLRTTTTGVPDRPEDLYRWPDPKERGVPPGVPPYEVECLIVNVPHPKRSGLGYWYDLTIDAIERALEQDEFVLYGAWLPTSFRKEAAKAAAPSAPPPANDRIKPGVLVFRRRTPVDKAAQLRVVFLVSETATAGLRMEMFRTAVGFCCARPGWTKERSVRVVGPYFSGSHESFSRALRQRVETNTVQFKICNGSATAIDEAEYNQHSCGMSDSYRATVIPDRIVTKWLVKYLADPMNPVVGDAKNLGKVAILRESNTVYGHEFDNERKQRTTSPDWIEVPFPLHISTLQGIYNKEFQDQLSKLGVPHTPGTISLPSEEGVQEGEAREAVPAVSPAATSADNNLIIQNILSTLAREDVRYVELIASDPRDKILLATLIRQRCPDVQLFTTIGDSLLAHPDFNTAMLGTVVGSTYPLDAEPQVLGGKRSTTKNQRLLFSNQSIQGIYNAVLLHIAELDPKSPAPRPPIDQMLGCDIPDETSDPSDTVLCGPTIWLGVIGQNGSIVPVYKVPRSELLKSMKDNNDPCAETLYKVAIPKSDLKNQPLTIQFTAYWVVWLLLLTVGVWWLLSNHLGTAGPVSGGNMVPGWPGPVVRIVGLGLTCLVIGGLGDWLFGSVLETCAVNLSPWNPDSSGWWPWVANILVGVCAFALMFMAAFYPLDRLRVRFWQSIWAVATVGASVAVAVFVSCVTGSLLFFGGQGRAGDTVNHVLYFERLAHVVCGLSPAVPAVLLAGGLVAWCYFLRREYDLLAESSVVNPFKDMENMGRPYHELARSSGQLLLSLNTFSLWPYPLPKAAADQGQAPDRKPRTKTAGVMGFLALLVVLAFLHVGARWVRSIDGRLFDWFIYLGLLLATLLTTLTLCHAYFIWGDLKSLLSEIAKLPLRKAFRRLPSQVKHVFDRAFYASTPGDTSLNFLGQQLRWLLANLPSDQTRFRQVIATKHAPALKNLEAALAIADKLPWSTVDLPDSAVELQGRRDKEKGLYIVFLACIKVLVVWWQTQSLEELYGNPRADDVPAGDQEKKESKEKSEPADAGVEWIRKAEDFVALVLTRFLSQLFVHLRNLLRAVTVGVILLLLTVTLYPFHPQELLFCYLGGLLAAVVGVVVFIFVRINHDEVMSNLANTTPNQFTPDSTFFREIVQYVLPVLGIVAVQFSAVSSLVRWAIEPLLRVVH